MGWLARWLVDVRVAVAVVVATLILAVVAGIGAVHVEQDDDLLAFLPEGNADIEAFQRISRDFGGLDVALVGIEAKDPFAPEFLQALRSVTEELRGTPGVDRVLSLANVEDFTEDPLGGIITADLIDHLPVDDADRAALRAKVMSRDAIVGNLISRDADAVLIYVFSAFGTDARALAGSVREVVERGFPEQPIYWGGAPFISTWIYDTTSADMARLTPWAVAAIVLIVLISFRDVVGSVLALFTTGMGIAVSRAAMAAMGVQFNVVLSAMPVILFAVGSAYSIHVLTRYYARAAEGDRQDALVQTLTRTGPVVLAAGLTTVAGLLSFVVMDIRPMRTFGVFTAIGILTTLVLSLTFVPAVVRLTRLKGRTMGTGAVAAVLAAPSRFALRHRLPVAAFLAVVAVTGGALVGRVDNRMDQAAFFTAGSPPDLANRFLDAHFGGSQFLQIHASGDLADPDVLREIRDLGDAIAGLDHVTQVVHAGVPIGAINEAMTGERRIPATRQQVGTLLEFLAGRAAVRQVLTDDRAQALMIVKIGTNDADTLEQVVAGVEEKLQGRGGSWSLLPTDTPAGRERLEDGVLRRVSAVLAEAGIAVPVPAPTSAHQVLGTPVEPDGVAVAAGLRRFLLSAENFAAVTEAEADAVVAVTVELGAAPDGAVWAEALRVALAPGETDDAVADANPAGEIGVDPELQARVDDLMVAVGPELEDLYARVAAAQGARALLAALAVTLPAGDAGERLHASVANAMLDLELPGVLAWGPGPNHLDLEVNGLPVLYRGMSRSVTRNQALSLVMALVLVVVIMTVLFRSLWSGLLATVPTALTLLVVYGGMGAMGVHLDIGTSMLASIIIGAGVDYAVHLMSAWRGDDLAEAVDTAVFETGPAIWTNALMVAAGFFVLTLGEARPLQNVGGLTAAAMISAALATFLAIPVLARRLRYAPRNTGG